MTIFLFYGILVSVDKKKTIEIKALDSDQVTNTVFSSVNFCIAVRKFKQSLGGLYIIY